MSNGEGNEGVAAIGQALGWLFKKKKEGSKAAGCILWSLLLAVPAVVILVIAGNVVGR